MPSTADVTEVETAYGTAVSADAFTGNITDATAVTVRFKEEPDFCRYGEQKVTVLLEDLGGNVTSYESSLLISPVKEETELEIGSEVPTVSDFLQEEAIKVLLPAGEAADGKAVLLSDVSEADMLALGEKTVYIRAEGHVFESMLRIVDTIPPVFSVHEVSAYTTSLLTAEQFVTEAEDATALTFYFQKDPVLAEGTQEVVIVAKDEGGNTTEAVASLTLKADTEAPVMKGVANRTVYIGDGISYKAGVTVTDNCDEDIELQVDSSGVDLNTEGNYHVTYSAKDRAGNETSQTITLTVRRHAYTQEEVDVLADKVLADIITPEMSDYDKLVAIYDWVRTHVSYINYSEKGCYGAGTLFHKNNHRLLVIALFRQAGCRVFNNCIQFPEGVLHFLIGKRQLIRHSLYRGIQIVQHMILHGSSSFSGQGAHPTARGCTCSALFFYRVISSLYSSFKTAQDSTLHLASTSMTSKKPACKG
jgi:hypothetical protein